MCASLLLQMSLGMSAFPLTGLKLVKGEAIDWKATIVRPRLLILLSSLIALTWLVSLD